LLCLDFEGAAPTGSLESSSGYFLSKTSPPSPAA
jgi:hypothetical protein